ncbi:hypothetical protein [Yinghuangia sp. YIM S10712]|uniref:hypothetical protein n=1 Tax=Yinghuangia sp. YIM S10712 TaxID=3436930 RepID=UPI003F52E4EE
MVEFIRELIVVGTHECLAARARGRVGGRPSVVSPELIRAARDMPPNPETSVTSIVKLLSPRTLYNHIPDPEQHRAAAVPHQQPLTPRNRVKPADRRVGDGAPGSGTVRPRRVTGRPRATSGALPGSPS